MAETINGTLAERRGAGQVFYKEGMRLSGPDKARVLEWVEPGKIVEGGPGTGVVSDLMMDRFPGSTFDLIDISDDMIHELLKKYKDKPKIHVVKHDIVNYDPGEPVDTYVHVSNIHEVFSEGGMEAVMALLQNDYNHTRTGGRIVIRDGIKPPPYVAFVRPISEFGAERAAKFLKDFKVAGEVPYEVGNFDSETLAWHPNKSAKIEPGKVMIRLPSFFANEMFSKYHYPEQNLGVEFSEQFGVMTLEEYQEALRKVGYDIIHAESYLIPYLQDKLYSRDFENYRLDKNGVPMHTSFTDSTAILAGVKRA